MKNKIFIALMMGAVVMNTSCKFEDEDRFDESASLRIEHFNDKVKQTLVSAEYGWNVQYFCGTEGGQFEGFNLYAAFDANGSVLMAGNHRMLRDGNAGKYTEYRSLYSLLEEDGPVLAFNSWNDIMTVFADPVDPAQAPGKLVNDGQGMAGDYNFIIESCTDDEITLIGQRYRARVRLVRCDRPWQEHIAAVSKTKSDITNNVIPAFYLTNGTDTMYVSRLSSGVITYTERLDNPLRVEQMACLFTLDGIHIEHEKALGEDKFQDLHMAPDSTMLVTHRGRVCCVPMWDKYVATHDELWTIDQETLTEEQKALIATIDAGLQTFNKNYSLAKISLGKSTGGNSVKGMVLTYYTNATKTKTNVCGMAMKSARTAFGEITVSVDADPRKDKNLENILKNAKTPASLGESIMALAESLCGTYTATPNNFFLPTGATYTCGEKTFTCEK